MNLFFKSSDVNKALSSTKLFVLAVIWKFLSIMLLFILLIQLSINFWLDLVDVACKNMVIHRVDFLSALHVPVAGMPVKCWGTLTFIRFPKIVQMNDSQVISHHKILLFVSFLRLFDSVIVHAEGHAIKFRDAGDRNAGLSSFKIIEFDRTVSTGSN